MPIESWSSQVLIAHLAADPHLGDDLQTLIERTRCPGVNAVLEFSGVSQLHSTHIAALLRLRKQVHESGGKLILCGLDTNVWGAFLMTGLDKIFEFTDAVPSALAVIQIADGSPNR